MFDSTKNFQNLMERNVSSPFIFCTVIYFQKYLFSKITLVSWEWVIRTISTLLVSFLFQIKPNKNLTKRNLRKVFNDIISLLKWFLLNGLADVKVSFHAYKNNSDNIWNQIKRLVTLSSYFTETQREWIEN